MEKIDRKFRILAVNPCKPGAVYTEADGFFFKAADAYAVDALEGYISAMIKGEKGKVGEVQITSARMLRDRVLQLQSENGSRTPDIEGTCETDRCIGGIGV